MTQFDTDQVKVVEFKEKYEKFCLQHRLQPVPITRELMASYGIERVRLEESFLERKKEFQEKLQNGEVIDAYREKRCCRCGRRSKFYAI